MDTRSLAERVYDHLRQSLLKGNLRPGESITIRGVAASLGASEMPVREAIKCLLTERVIFQKPNRSFQVPTLNQEELKELFSIRVSIEGTTTLQALPKANDDLIEHLTKLNDNLRKVVASGDIAVCLEADQAFHFALYGASDSDILMQMIELLWMRSGPYVADIVSRIGDVKTYFGTSAENHDAMIKALVDQEKNDLFDALRQDLFAPGDIYAESAEFDAISEFGDKVVLLPKAGL